MLYRIYKDEINIARMAFHYYTNQSLLNIKVLDRFGVGLGELFSRLNFISHENIEE
jgi:hypothetical protein